MSDERNFEERLAMWAKWYHYNKDRIPRDNIGKRMDFQEKTIDGLLELLALAGRRIQVLEQGRVPSLLLPTGVTVTGDLTRFG